MPRTHRIFISHAWKYGDDYDRLVRLLDGARYFSYANYSAPKDNPLTLPGAITKESIRQAIRDKIRPVHIVLVISGMYVYNSEWIQYEIDTARSYEKPIVALEPWGSERFPVQIEPYIKERTGWRTDDIVNAILRHSPA